MGKRAFLLKLIQDIRASYWFLPSILVFIGLLLASVTGWVDRNPSVMPFELPKTWTDTQADGARSTLAVIAQSVVGVAGVMFSMTLVAVSFASGNFGPRLIGNFMRDRGNQWSLGILISTFVYALVVLRTVQDDFDGGVSQFVPQYSLVVAVGLSLLCVFTLIFFVHHVPETINVSRISASIGTSLERHVRGLIDEQQDDGPIVTKPRRDPDTTITAGVSGYIQTVNFDQLEKCAEQGGWHVNLASSIGDFVTVKTNVFEVWVEDELTDKDISNIKECYAIGASRTENQNPTFLAEQLVEMIARALSPGVNDPYTAMDCMNRLAGVLTIASTYKDGLQERSLPHITFSALTFERLFAASFPLCRQYIKPDDMVLNHAKTLLGRLADVARKQDRSVIDAEIEKLSD